MYCLQFIPAQTALMFKLWICIYLFVHIKYSILVKKKKNVAVLTKETVFLFKLTGV